MIRFSPYLPNVCTLDLGSELRPFASLDNPSLLPIRVIHDLTLLHYPERHSRGCRTLKSRYVCDAPDPEPRSHESHPVGSVLIKVINRQGFYHGSYQDAGHISPSYSGNGCCQPPVPSNSATRTGRYVRRDAVSKTGEVPRFLRQQSKAHYLKLSHSSLFDIMSDTDAKRDTTLPRKYSGSISMSMIRSFKARAIRGQCLDSS
jgi:hypothetical protein